VYEFEQFDRNESDRRGDCRIGAYSLRGGETLAAIAKYGVPADFLHLDRRRSFLEFLEGKKLPAIEVLEQRAKA